MDMDRDLQYIGRRSMQERPITLGELLRREDMLEGMEPAPPMPMSRTMSPTRCLGPLAIGRPRRARGRTLSRPSTSTSTSADLSEEDPSDSQPQYRRRRATSGPFTLPALTRWRSATAEARLRNFHYLMNEPRRRGTSGTARPRQRSLERSDSPDLFYNPFSWQRRHTARARQTRSRSATYAGSRSRPVLHGRSHRIRTSTGRVAPGSSRMSDIFDSREEQRAYRYLRAGRPHSGRTDPDLRRNTINGTSWSDVSATMLRFIDFAAEFIPVQLPLPDAEPPEWSLNVTAADLGPFAIGRSALSRARSLAMVGALSQVDNNEPTDAQSSSDEN